MFYYAVVLQTGYNAILNDWPSCQEIINLEPEGARFKKFFSQEEAQAFIDNKPPDRNDPLFLKHLPMPLEFEECYNQYDKSTLAYVYGNCFPQVGVWSYGTILFLNKDKDYQYFTRIGTNNLKSMKLAGDVYGTCRAIQESINAGYPHITVCYQYEGIEKWATSAFKKTKSLLGIKYAEAIRKYAEHIDISFKKIYFTKDNAILQKAYNLSREALGVR